MRISVDVNGVDRAVAHLTGMQKQVRFATAVALTRSAVAVAKDAEAMIPTTFDRPKPYTVKGTYTKRATPASLEAVVGIKDKIAGYLAPNIGKNGKLPRTYKNSERMLRAAGILPEGRYTVPGKEARLDEYGNMSRGQIVQILSYFRTFGNTQTNSKRMNMTDKGRARLASRAQDYFVVPIADRDLGIYPGIWQRRGRTDIVPVLMFVSRPQYRAIYDFYGEAERKLQSIFDKEFRTALADALRTAR
jgi:hypothetical protein